MAIHDIFSKRQKRLRGEVPDVYKYDEIPLALRNQIVLIWDESIGDESQYNSGHSDAWETYKLIVDVLCKEHGVLQLDKQMYGDRDYREELVTFLLEEKDTEKVIDAIEVSFGVVYAVANRRGYVQSKAPVPAIAELNDRFKEHGIGYQFEEGRIIRVDSQVLHEEAVKPALQLLHAKEYAGAQQEFLSAHEHHRHGRNKEALNDALKAFESTMKAVCRKRGWQYDPKDMSKQLIDICFQNDLVPKFWQGHMGAIRSLLEGGVPTGRNKLSAHGQGSTPTNVPEHIVSYVLHMTAAAIVFLVKSEENMK